MICVRPQSYAEWREKARALLAAGAAPERVVWEGSSQDLLFQEEIPPALPGPVPRVPPAFLESAERAACFRGARKWDTLYRLLWRLVHENRNLLEVASDEDVRELRQWKPRCAATATK